MSKGMMSAREVRRRMATAAFLILTGHGLSTREIARQARLPFRSVYRWIQGDVPHDTGLSKLWALVRRLGTKP